jgi:hypothetical protein
MTLPGPVAAQVGADHRQARYGWRIVAMFAVAQTLGYGFLYYAFADESAHSRDFAGLASLVNSRL